MIQERSSLRHNNGRMLVARPTFALFNIFLPAVSSDSELSAVIQSQINDLVTQVGATGYTLLPPSVGLWFHDDTICQDCVHPIQIVVEDTPSTYEQIEKFVRAVASLLSQRWLYVFQVPVRVNEPTGRRF